MLILNSILHDQVPALRQHRQRHQCNLLYHRQQSEVRPQQRKWLFSSQPQLGQLSFRWAKAQSYTYIYPSYVQGLHSRMFFFVFLEHVCINWWHWNHINKKTHFDVWFNKHRHWWNNHTSAKIGHSSDHCQTSWYQSDTKYSDQIKFGLVKFDNINNSSFFHFIAGKAFIMVTR